MQDRLSDLGAHVQENLSGIRTIQAMVQEDIEIKRFERHQPSAMQTPSIAMRRINVARMSADDAVHGGALLRHHPRHTAAIMVLNGTT